jgi:hypothetical protein
MASSSLGLTIGISPDMARKLRQESAEPEEPSSLSALEAISSKQPLDSSKTKDDEDLPCISIHLEGLIGYQPSDSDELDSIRSQLVEAMWTSYQQTSSDGQPISSESERLSQPPPDFDRQVMEFFESGVARYEESLNHDNEGYLSIRYPAYLQSPVTGERISTRKIVAEIQQKEPDSLEFASKLWKYLRECSMTLFWKRNMAAELALLVREEQARLDYQEWTESKRQSKLDNLYSIRETLVHQVDLAKSKMELLEEERNAQVEGAMEPFRRKVQQRQQDSLDAFGTTELSFPDEFQWLGLRDEPLVDEGDDWGIKSDNEEDDCSDDDGSYDSVASNELADESSVNDDTEVVAESPIVNPLESALADIQEMESVQVQVPAQDDGTTHAASTEEKAEPEPELSIPFQKRKERREKSKRRKRHESKTAEQRARQEQLQKLEDELRSKLTSKELIFAQTMNNALTEKMTKIEELLDSLQDEVWQAEEESEEQSKSGKTDLPPGGEFAFSLLDQVLAMIFGATPMHDGKSPEEHYTFMQNEHKVIVAAWEAHFGRLPPPTVGSSSSGPSTQETTKEELLTSKEHRKELGIAENDDDDWEAVENWDDLLDDKKTLTGEDDSNSKPPSAKDSPEQSKDTTAKSAKSEKPPAPKLVGLRPGGSVVRPSHN